MVIEMRARGAKPSDYQTLPAMPYKRMASSWAREPNVTCSWLGRLFGTREGAISRNSGKFGWLAILIS